MKTVANHFFRGKKIEINKTAIDRAVAKIEAAKRVIITKRTNTGNDKINDSSQHEYKGN